MLADRSRPTLHDGHHRRRGCLSHSENRRGLRASRTCVVMGPSMVERIGMEVESQMMMPCTPLCELMRFSVSSTSDMAPAAGALYSTALTQ